MYLSVVLCYHLLRIDLYVHRLTQLCKQLFQFIWKGAVFIATYFDLKNHHYVTINKITLICSKWTGRQNGCKIVNMDYQNCGIVSSFLEPNSWRIWSWETLCGRWRREHLLVPVASKAAAMHRWTYTQAWKLHIIQICSYFCIIFWFDFRVLYLYIKHLLL